MWASNRKGAAHCNGSGGTDGKPGDLPTVVDDGIQAEQKLFNAYLGICLYLSVITW